MPILPLWAFVASYRVNFASLSLSTQFTWTFTNSRQFPVGFTNCSCKCRYNPDLSPSYSVTVLLFHNPDKQTARVKRLRASLLQELPLYRSVQNLPLPVPYLKTQQLNYTEWPKKCIHSLLFNIFGINLNEISISGWECNIMFSQRMAQALL